MAKTRFIDAAAAAALIKDGDTVAISGNGAGMVSAEAIFEAIEKRFLETGHPRDLTLVHSLGLGDRDQLGTNRFAHEGMVRKVIAAHFTWSPKMQQLIKDEKVEAYCFPGGVIQHLLREIGAGRPGLFTHSGVGTFADPRQDAGRCNARSQETLVELMNIDGKDILRYKPFKVDVAIVRGTYADTQGNISPEEEPIDMDIHSMALAAHNSGGIVLAQVRQTVEAGSLHSRHVRIPGIMVDAVVESPEQLQFYGRPYDPTVSGAKRAALDAASAEAAGRDENACRNDAGELHGHGAAERQLCRQQLGEDDVLPCGDGVFIESGGGISAGDAGVSAMAGGRHGGRGV